jgi:hypothetical protein
VDFELEPSPAFLLRPSKTECGKRWFHTLFWGGLFFFAVMGPSREAQRPRSRNHSYYRGGTAGGHRNTKRGGHSGRRAPRYWNEDPRDTSGNGGNAGGSEKTPKGPGHTRGDRSGPQGRKDPASLGETIQVK